MLNKIDRLTQIQHGSLSTISYPLYDKVGNRKQKTDSLGTHTYTYDNTYQLTSSVIASGSEAIYNYDSVGNRTSASGTGIPSSYTPNSLNQYASVDSIPYTYDLNGNLTNDGTRTYEYDFENRLIKSTVIASASEAIYSYDPFGRRLSSSLRGAGGDEAISYLYDGDQIIEVFPCNLTAVPCTLNASFLHGPSIDEPLEVTQHPSLTSHYYHQDGLGSITALTNASGSSVESYTYDAYGIPEIKNSSGSVIPASLIGNPFLFTAREYDSETSLYYYRNRYYSPKLGRFISRDKWPGRITDPSQLVNKYTYVTNNPLNFLDPFGFEKKKMEEEFDPASDAIEPIPLWEDPIFIALTGLKPTFPFKINVRGFSEPTHIGFDIWGRNIIHYGRSIVHLPGRHIAVWFNEAGTALYHIYRNRIVITSGGKTIIRYFFRM